LQKILTTYSGIFLLILSSFSLGINNPRQFKHLYKGEHKTVGIQLISNADTNKLFLRVSEKGIRYSIHEYLSFKSEPYLSDGITVICDADTLHPAVTNVEKTYEAGNEIIYMMVFSGNIHKKCEAKQFIIYNFTAFGDTLTINMNKTI
jgi:hypothetical protein